MSLPKPEIRLTNPDALPNPAGNAPPWEEDPDRVVARLANESAISAVSRIGGSQRLHVVLRGTGGQPLPAQEVERLLAQHGLEVLETAVATEVVARVRPEPNLAPGATIPHVDVSLSGPSGARALFFDDTGAHVRVTAENRVALVYFLADAFVADRLEGTSQSDVGWRSNQKASVAVWGRTGQADPRRLKSLVFNLRAVLRAGGIDPWCIEKRRGAVRLRVRSAQVS